MLNKKFTQKTISHGMICIFILPFILAACNKSSKATPTATGLSPNAVNTAAALTAESRRSQTSSQTPTSIPMPTFDTTSIAVTQAAATLQAQVTPSPVGTAAITPATLAVSPTPTPVLPVGQDNSVFTGKETIPDGTNFAPGAKFTKSWQFLNNGQTTWTTGYTFAFVSGEQMGGPASVPVKIEVSAGRVIDISVDLTAPTTTGSYKGNWRLKNAAGQAFGDIVYVQINVTEGGGTGTTATAPATGKVVSVTLSAVKNSYNGTCPHAIDFTAEVKVNRDADVTFVLEFGGGLTHAAMSPETTSISEGTVELSFSPEFNVSGSGWVRLHVTAPNNITSNNVDISITCK